MSHPGYLLASSPHIMYKSTYASLRKCVYYRKLSIADPTRLLGSPSIPDSYCLPDQN